MDNKTGLLPITDIAEIQRWRMRIMFGFIRKKKQEKSATELASEVVRAANHDEANVRDAILTSNVS